MSFNVAIFYDIENLLKGYNFSQQLINNLSITNIVKEINETEDLGKIALQRAYANWSDPRLGTLRGEINELGIDPIQVFGFSRDHKKNAADIQLTIDAIDLVHIRPAIEFYIIVSGDGGFAALAKKLHEYGKTVIGCAYQNMSNRIFMAVCDAFIPIPDPEAQEQPNFRITNLNQITDPKVVRLIPLISEAVKNHPDDGVALTKAVLNIFAEDTISCKLMKETGIYLSSIREAVRYAIPGFQQSKFGFPKFTEFLQYVCKDTPLCIVRPEHSAIFLTLKDSIPVGAEVLPELDVKYLHSVQHYRSILATGSPMFRLPSPMKALQKIAEWLIQNPLKQEIFGTVIDNAAQANSPEIDPETVKLSILCFASTGIFNQSPDNVAISEQTLTLKDEYTTVSNIMSALQQGIHNKIFNSVTPVNDETISTLLSEELAKCSNPNSSFPV